MRTKYLARDTGRRLQVYLELRDLWVGVFVDVHAVYVCPLPCVVLRWARRP